MNNTIKLSRNLGNGKTIQYEKSFAVYPSSFVQVPESNYENALSYISGMHNKSIYTDGEEYTFIIPEENSELISLVCNEFQGNVISTGQCKDQEFVTKAIADGGIEAKLINLGNSVIGLAGTADEMIQKAKNYPIETLKTWAILYRNARSVH
ncbi:hypothetical protein [Vibrio sp. 10N.239.312.D08]|uniref:hypothetical protein n=1 Tax=Vibrio sp. 10N.239.312.D08 TaxID=3229978 RepID=UPI00354AE3CD